jgi:hypothetical protein
MGGDADGRRTSRSMRNRDRPSGFAGLGGTPEHSRIAHTTCRASAPRPPRRLTPGARRARPRARELTGRTASAKRCRVRRPGPPCRTFACSHVRHPGRRGVVEAVRLSLAIASNDGPTELKSPSRSARRLKSLRWRSVRTFRGRATQPATSSAGETRTRFARWTPRGVPSTAWTRRRCSRASSSPRGRGSVRAGCSRRGG